MMPAFLAAQRQRTKFRYPECGALWARERGVPCSSIPPRRLPLCVLRIFDKGRARSVGTPAFTVSVCLVNLHMTNPPYKLRPRPLFAHKGCCAMCTRLEGCVAWSASDKIWTPLPDGSK